MRLRARGAGGAAVRVVVVGGGIAGLAAAHRFLERSRWSGASIDLTLLEAERRVGGVIRTEQRDGFLLEAGPDSFLNDRPQAMDMCRRLELDGERVGTQPGCRKGFVALGGRLVPIPEGFSLVGPARFWPLAASSTLSPWGKLRALLEPMVPRRTDGSDESVAAFVRRRFGREVLERLAGPMIRGMASGDPEDLSARALLRRFLEMEDRCGSVIRGLRVEAAGRVGGLFLSFRLGMQRMVDRLAERLPPGAVRLNSRAVGLRRGSGGCRWLVRTEAGKEIAAEAVCVALPAFRAAGLLRGVDAELAERLGQARYASWTTVYLPFRREDVRHPMRGFGFVVPRQASPRVAGCTFVQMKFPGRAPEGKVLLRVFLEEEEGEFQRHSDMERVSWLCGWLRPLLGIRGEPLWSAVFRAPRSLPQYRPGHSAWAQDLEERVRLQPGLALAGNAYGGHGVSACLSGAEQAVDRIWDSLQNA